MREMRYSIQIGQPDRQSMRVIGRWLLPLVSLLILAGCTSDSNEDLYRYVDSVKARKAGKIKPLPDFKTYESFSYAASDLRDPFVSKTDETDIDALAATGPGLKPDLTRHKEALEAFPLDTLHYVGELKMGDQAWAIITAPDGLVYRVKKGNYLGQNYGKIINIMDVRIEIAEIIPDGLGGWIEREAALSLAE